MPTKQEMLDRVMEEIADKTLSFWCKVLMHPHIKKETIFLSRESDEDSCMWAEYYHFHEIRKESPYLSHPVTYREFDTSFPEYTIIWHPIMLTDILNYVDKNLSWPFRGDYALALCDLRIDKKQPIEKQSTKLIEKVYSLLPTK